MANLKKIIDLPELTETTGTETVVGTSDSGATIRIPVKNISGASLDELANLNELEEAVGDETVIGVSNGSVVRIPVDAIGGGSVEPMLLRATSTSGFGGNIVYTDGSSVTITDIYNAFIAGIPIIVGQSTNGDRDENGYPMVGGIFTEVISVSRSNSKITVIVGTELKQFSVAS